MFGTLVPSSDPKLQWLVMLVLSIAVRVLVD